MQARRIASDRYSVWHAWGVTNYDQVLSIGERTMKANDKLTESDVMDPVDIYEEGHTTKGGYGSDAMQLMTGTSTSVSTSNSTSISNSNGNSLSTNQQELLTKARRSSRDSF